MSAPTVTLPGRYEVRQRHWCADMYAFEQGNLFNAYQYDVTTVDLRPFGTRARSPIALKTFQKAVEDGHVVYRGPTEPQKEQPPPVDAQRVINALKKRPDLLRAVVQALLVEESTKVATAWEEVTVQPSGRLYFLRYVLLPVHLPRVKLVEFTQDGNNVISVHERNDQGESDLYLLNPSITTVDGAKDAVDARLVEEGWILCP